MTISSLPLLVRFLIRHAAIGFGIALLFVGLLGLAASLVWLMVTCLWIIRGQV